MNKTYAIGDTAIHAIRTGAAMTVCGKWRSDVKPMSPSAITCLLCGTILLATRPTATVEPTAGLLSEPR